MGENEDRFVEWLLSAESVDEAVRILIGGGQYDVDGLVEALVARADRFDADGLTAHAELTRFFIPLVEEHRKQIGWGRVATERRDPFANLLDGDDGSAVTLLTLPSAGGLLDSFFALRRTLASGEVSADAVRRYLLESPLFRSEDYLLPGIAAAFLAGSVKDRIKARARWIADCHRRGAIANAERHLGRLAHLAATDEATSWGVLQALGDLGDSLLEAGAIDAAIDVCRRAAAVPSALQEENLSVALQHYRLAGELRRLGRPREALDVLAELEDRGFHPSRIGMLSDLPGVLALGARINILSGLLSEDLGQYEQGRTAYEFAMKLAAAANDDHLEFSARSYVAGSYLKAGRLRAAVQGFRRVIDWDDEYRGYRAAALNNLAMALLRLGNENEARRTYEQVIAIHEASGQTGTSTSIAWFGLGDLAAGTGDFVAAGEAYDKAFSLADHGSRRDVTIMLLTRLHRLAAEAERFEPILRSALEEAERSDDWMLMRFAAQARADLLQRSGNQDEAIVTRRKLRDAARERGAGPVDVAACTLSLARALADHSAAGRDEAFDLLWAVRDSAGAVALLIDLLTSDRPPRSLPDSRSPVELAFDVHEEAKARDLVGHLAMRPLPPPSNMPRELWRREQALMEERRTLTGAWASAGGLTESARRGKLRANERALGDLHAEMQTYSPGYVRLRAARPATLAELRDHLRGQSEVAVVSLFCADDVTTVFTYVPATDQLTVDRAPIGGERLRQVAQRLRRTFNGDPLAFPSLGPLPARRPWKRDLGFFEECAPSLLTFLPRLDGRDLVCVAPHGPLHALPLHALPTAGGVLAQRHAVTYVPSITTMLYTSARRSDARPGDRAFCAGVAAREDPDPERFETDGELLTAAGWEVDGLSGLQATRDEVLGELGDRSVAHITCHGFIDSVMPLDSGLLLADGVDRPSRVPGTMSIRTRLRHLLTAGDLAQARFQVDLLTLRACSTGVYDTVEGVTNLAHAMLYAGVNTVVGALWNVDRDTSASLLAAFYRRRISHRHEPTWRSLWLAQRAMIERPEHAWEAHPYHWAALVLFGHWG